MKPSRFSWLFSGFGYMFCYFLCLRKDKAKMDFLCSFQDFFLFNLTNRRLIHGIEVFAFSTVGSDIFFLFYIDAVNQMYDLN